MGIHISKLSLVRAAWQEYHKHESKQNMQWCVHHYCFVLGWCPPRKSHLQLITLTVACVASLVITTSRNFQNDLTNGFAGILLAAPRDCNWLRNLMLDITSLWPYNIKSELIKCASWAIVIRVLSTCTQKNLAISEKSIFSCNHWEQKYSVNVCWKAAYSIAFRHSSIPDCFKTSMKAAAAWL